MKKQSKPKIENLAAIESPLLKELTPEEANKISGGKRDVMYCPGDPVPEPPPSRPYGIFNL